MARLSYKEHSRIIRCLFQIKRISSFYSTPLLRQRHTNNLLIVTGEDVFLCVCRGNRFLIGDVGMIGASVFAKRIGDAIAGVMVLVPHIRSVDSLTRKRLKSLKRSRAIKISLSGPSLLHAHAS